MKSGRKALSRRTGASRDAAPTKRGQVPASNSQAESKDAIFDRFPAVFIETVRSLNAAGPKDRDGVLESADKYAYAGVGLGDMGLMQISPIRKQALYDPMDYLSSAGQAALNEVENAKMRRARDKSTAELKTILDRVKLALDEFASAQVELEIPESPPATEKRKRKKKRRRRSEEEGAKEEESGNPQATQEEKEDGNGSGSECSSSEGSNSEEELGEEAEKDEEETYRPGLPCEKQKLSREMLRKLAKRRWILQLISYYGELCVEREDLIRQMQHWIESTVEEEFIQERPGVVYCFSPDLLQDARPVGIAQNMETFRTTMEKLKKVADSLGIGESKAEEEPADSTGRRPPPPSRQRMAPIFNVEELRSSDNWQQAVTLIFKTFEEAIKAIPVRRIRLNLANNTKQFKYMCKAMESRVDLIKEQAKQIANGEEENNKAKKEIDDLKKNRKKMQVKLDKFQHQNGDLQNKLKDQEKLIDELTTTLEEYKQKESYGLYKTRSSSDSFESDLGSKESMSVTIISARPSLQGPELGPTGEKFEIRTPRSSETTVKVTKAKTKDKSIPAEGNTAGERQVLPEGEAAKLIDELKNSLKSSQMEVEVEKEKLAALEEEFQAMQAEKVKTEQERSDLEIQLEDAKRESERQAEEFNEKLEEKDRESKKLTGEIECNEEMIKYQEERIAQFLEEIQAMEDRIMSLPGTPLASRASLAMKPSFRRERRKTSIQLGLEPNTARQMVAKVKQQYEAEIEGLKEHLTRENNRHLADMRRTEGEHKKDVQNIHKESMQVMRSINRFKDCIANLLDREALHQEAFIIRKLPPLPLEDNPQEIRQILARMAILSNELLFNMEMNLSKALMSKRIDKKDATPPGKGQGSKAVDGRKGKDQGKRQADKAKEDMGQEEIEMMVLGFIQEGNYMEVMDVVKSLFGQKDDLNKEITSASKAHEEALQKRESHISKMRKREEVFKKKIDDQKTVIGSLASIWKSRRVGQKFISREAQLANMKLLEEALASNQVSKTLCETTMKLVKQSMDFPRKRFIDLVQKYVQFIKIKEMKDKVKALRTEPNLNDDTAKFIQGMEERLAKQKETWQKRKDQFVKTRAEVLEQLSQVITQLSEETNLMFIKPVELTPRLEDIQEAARDIGEEDILEAASIPRERAKYRRRLTRAQLFGRPPSPLAGMGVQAADDQGAVWKASGTMPHTLVTTPRLLELDINQTRQAAQNILVRLSKETTVTSSTSLPPLSSYTSGVLANAVPKTQSEPWSGKTVPRQHRAWLLPPVATLYPDAKEE